MKIFDFFKTKIKLPTLALLKREKWRQLRVTLSVNFISMAATMSAAWTTPIIPQLLTKDTPVGKEPMTQDQISWLSSVVVLMPLVALPIAAVISEKFGRKIATYVIAFPAIASWLLILLADNFYHLLIARMLAGFVLGMTFSVVPFYITEMADDAVRGQLASLFSFAITFGGMVSLILGATVSYHVFATCGLVVPVIFLVTFIFMPEAPIYLLRKGRIEEATRSLMWLRNDDKDLVACELDKLKVTLAETSKSSKSVGIKDLWRNRGTLHGFFITAGLLTGQHASGFAVVVSYSVLILKIVESPLDANIAAIIIAGMKIVGSWMSTLTINRFGRRTLILCSCIVMGLSHLSLGIYFLLLNRDYVLSAFSWLPAVLLCFYALAYSSGLGPIAYIVASEVLSPDIANLSISLSMITHWSTSFILVKFFPLVSDTFGEHTAFFILTIGCALTFVFTLFMVPETKDKSMIAIFEELNGAKEESKEFTERYTKKEEKA